MSDFNGGPAINDDDIIRAVQLRIRNRSDRMLVLEEELDGLRQQHKRDERVIALLRGESAKPGPKTARPPRGTQVGDQKLAAIEAGIRRFAEDHEEFRQVDIRTMPDPPTTSSGAIATAFDKLRERNVIRFVRQDGNNKIFRLTREAVTAESES